MEAQASQGVAGRALCVGTAVGAVTGALTPAFAGLTTDGWRIAAFGLIVGPVGAVCGAAVGFACAIVPSVLLALYRNYFLRHDWLARLCAVSFGVMLLIVAAVYTAVHWNGNIAYEAIATLPLACGLILSARSTDRILNGRAVSGRRCCYVGRA